MNQPPSPARGRLAAIARNAMQERGLLPDFSPAAITELQAVAQAGAATVHTAPRAGDGIRDLRPVFKGDELADLPGQPAEGHFGLSVHDYSHSTAPNRRYPDLVTQRLIKAALAGAAVPYSNDELQQLALHCTAQEDNAAKVERQVRKSAAAMLLGNRVGQRFDAIVTGASDKGAWVRIADPAVEGKLANGAKGLDVGDRVKVKLLHINIERGFIDFGREGIR